MRRFIEHCGLEWHDACIDFHKTKRSTRTASLTQVRQPIYKIFVENADGLMKNAWGHYPMRWVI